MAEDALSGKLRCTYRWGLFWEYTSVLTLQVLAYGIEATSTMANAQEALVGDAVANDGEPSPTTDEVDGYGGALSQAFSEGLGRATRADGMERVADVEDESRITSAQQTRTCKCEARGTLVAYHHDSALRRRVARTYRHNNAA